MFPQTMEEGKRSSCLKKGNKQLINNYRPVSLLPIYIKFLKKLFLTLFSKELRNHVLLIIRMVSLFCSIRFR